MEDTDMYCIDRRVVTQNEKRIFLDEVHLLCPLCGNSIIKKTKHKTTFDFEIAHIYPNSPTSKEIETLKDVERDGDNSEDPKNLIALCTSCHTHYDKNKTLEEYYGLLRKKRELYSQQIATFDLSKSSVEDEISSVLDSIENLDDETLHTITRLDYSVLRINEKIEPQFNLLRNKVRNYVAEYYSFVETEFKNIDCNKSKRFDIICCEIKTAYLKCKSNEYRSQEAVFNSLVDWLASKTHGNKIACEIVISFFIQNCQVYDKISE